VLQRSSSTTREAFGCATMPVCLCASCWPSAAIPCGIMTPVRAEYFCRSPLHCEHLSCSAGHPQAQSPLRCQIHRRVRQASVHVPRVCLTNCSEVLEQASGARPRTTIRHPAIGGAIRIFRFQTTVKNHRAEASESRAYLARGTLLIQVLPYPLPVDPPIADREAKWHRSRPLNHPTKN